MRETVFRLTILSDGQLKPAFCPVADAMSFEEAYKTFSYSDEVELVADLVSFNSMSFLFEDFDIPGFDPRTHDRASRDLALKGTVQEDGSIDLNDGRHVSVDTLWNSFGLDVPSFTHGMRL